MKAEKSTPQAGDYVLMNIPYSQFYAAETGSNATSVDVFTSATKSKTKNTGLAGGSYHAKEDGSEITGITFPVKVTESAAGIDWSQYAKAESQEDLFGSASYAYSLLSEAPASYKELSVAADGTLSFGKTEGASAQTIDGSDGIFTTESRYGDYEIDFGTDSATYAALKDATIYGAVVNTTDGFGYGMRHLENIWKTGKHGFELAWCTGFTDAVHGCPTSSAHYESMMGKTIKDITVYSSAGTFTVSVGEKGVYIPVKSNDVNVSAQDASLDSDSPTVAVEMNLPSDFDAEYSVAGWDTVEFADQQAHSAATRSLKVPAGTQPGSYTLVAKDKSGKYAAVSCHFLLTTAKEVVKFDGSAVVAANEGDDISGYLKNIASVSVNGTSYAATGRGAVKIINAADGSIDRNAASRDAKVFDGYGTYQVEVQATGYENSLKFELTIEADKTALNAAIAAAEELSNNDGGFSAQSWNDFQTALSTAKAVSEDAASSDELVSQALKGLNDAQSALQASEKANLSYTVSQADQLKESDYTLATWSAFSQDLAYAKGLLDKANSQPGSVTDNEFSDANAALKASMQGLAKAATAADQTSLAVEIGKADVLKESDYTADSWKAYQSALAAAKAVYAKEDASAAEVQQATADLAAARQALVEASAGNNGSGNETGAGSNNGTGNGSSSDNGSDSDNGSGNGSDNGSSEQNADDQPDSGSGSEAPQTGDALAGVAGGFAALAAAAAGAVAWARRRMLGK